MGTSGNKQGGFKFMNLGSMKKVTRRSWDAILIPDTSISLFNTPIQGQPNDLKFLDQNNHPIGDLDIIGVGFG